MLLDSKEDSSGSVFAAALDSFWSRPLLWELMILPPRLRILCRHPLNWLSVRIFQAASADRATARHSPDFGRRPMRFVQSLLIGGMVLLAPAAARAQNDPAAQVKDVAGGKPTIELVFVIDTTGSMGGLIEGAKQKVWSIVNEVMKSPSKPEVRMGLVAYRDHGDAYVTQVTPITRDLDSIYNTLMAYKAEGGGDSPEDVRQALADGVHKVGWSPRPQHRPDPLSGRGRAAPR